MLKTSFIVLVLLIPKLDYAQLRGLGVQVDIGTSNTNLSEFNKLINSSGLKGLDEFSYHRGLSLIIPMNDISVKGSYSLSEYLIEDINTLNYELRYTNWQLNGILLRSILESENVSVSFGLGVSFSTSSINYYRSTGINPFTNDSSSYFYMSRNNNIGFRGELNLLFNVYKWKNSNQLLAGLNSVYCLYPTLNDWVNISGMKINNAPEIKDNTFYLNLSVVYRYLNN